MIDAVIKYIDFLREAYGLSITIHDKSGLLCPYMDQLVSYNVHSNPYCLFIKSNRELWDLCIKKQESVAKSCTKGAYFGMCYAGVEEFVFPISDHQPNPGFVSVSGYRKNTAKAMFRIRCLAERYHLNADKLRKSYQHHLCTNIPDKTLVCTLVRPLCAMLLLLSTETVRQSSFKMESKPDADYIYGHVLAYLRQNYVESVSLNDLCALCHCSRSYISHLFKRRCGLSVRAYVNQLRLEEAKLLLQNTRLSVAQIAGRVGFSDPNYFTHTFTHTYGLWV